MGSDSTSSPTLVKAQAAPPQVPARIAVAPVLLDFGDGPLTRRLPRRVSICAHTRDHGWPRGHRGGDFDVIGRSGSVEGQLPNTVSRIGNVQYATRRIEPQGDRADVFALRSLHLTPIRAAVGRVVKARSRGPHGVFVVGIDGERGGQGILRQRRGVPRLASIIAALGTQTGVGLGAGAVQHLSVRRRDGQAVRGARELQVAPGVAAVAAA